MLTCSICRQTNMAVAPLKVTVDTETVAGNCCGRASCLIQFYAKHDKDLTGGAVHPV